MISSGGPTLVAVDLGAESCRVSMLQWQGEAPHITMVRRFANAPVDHGAAGLRWDLERIRTELDFALHACAGLAPGGIDGIGVTGWAVDYVRLDPKGQPLAAPHCYRDPRAQSAMAAVHAILPAEQLYARTGVQIQPLNTIYQLYADRLAGNDAAPWVNLPESILHWLGAPRIAETTNATHTALIEPGQRAWCEEIFSALGLNHAAAPEVIEPGTVLGPVRADLRSLPAFARTQIIAPACHDTASAVAGIPGSDKPWAYLSSGTWSLVGMLQPQALRTPEACAAGFTNLGAADGQILFHRGIAGMWLLQQCLKTWAPQRAWAVEELIAEARRVSASEALIDLDDPVFIPPGDMPARINAQRISRWLAPLAESEDAAPQFAALIFHSLAARYAETLREITKLTGLRPERICIVGGGSRNAFLNELTSAATGLPVVACAQESSTLGNFAVQWAALESHTGVAVPDAIARHAAVLAVAVSAPPREAIA
ncbi:MAG: FGGY-family carbohydrate kinase [Acidobacteriaceae bacterium]